MDYLEGLEPGELDLVILENVGNLVCPAEFDTGASKNMTILSVPEGDDKPLKYPLMYEVCDLLVINKKDVMEYFDFDPEKVELFFEGEGKRIAIYRDGRGTDYSEEEAGRLLSLPEVRILVDMKSGEEEATAWGCDLTLDYVKINADYRS